jgi:hypothetical protein
MAEKSKPQLSEEVAFEKIDQAREKIDTFSELVLDIINYIDLNEDQSQIAIKERLAIERKLKKYQEQNTANWLFNLILKITEKIK